MHMTHLQVGHSDRLQVEFKRGRRVSEFQLN
jgi:hypothetical protein